MEFGRSLENINGSQGGKHTYVERDNSGDVRYFIRMPLIRVPKFIWVWYSKATKSYIPKNYI